MSSILIVHPDRKTQRVVQRVLGGTDKIILDSSGQSGSGVVPYLPLTGLRPPAPPASRAAGDRTAFGESKVQRSQGTADKVG